MDTEGERRRDELGDGECHIYTMDIMHKIDSQREPAVQLGELYPMLSRPKWERHRKTRDMYTAVIQLLSCV